MLRKVFIILISIFINSHFVYAEEGYFDIQNSSQYLGFSNMSKEFGITSVMNSAVANDFKATKIFIASGDDLTQRNSAGVTALHLAARNNAFETAQILIQNGANINAIDNEGWTPLMRASLTGDFRIMKLLIDSGANIWTQNNYNETSLVHSAMADCYECGKIILQSNKNTSNDFLTKNQINKALNIVKKRYNEPFIKLLSDYNGENYKFEDIKSDDIETDNMKRLIYVFTGKTVSKEQINNIGKNNYNYSLKKQEKLNNEAIILNMDEEDKSITYKNYNTKNYKLNENRKTNSEIPKIRKNIYDFNGQQRSLEEIEKNKIINKDIFVLNPNISKPIIENSIDDDLQQKKFTIQKLEEENKQQSYKLHSKDLKNKYNLNSMKTYKNETKFKLKNDSPKLKTEFILNNDIKDLSK